MTYYTTPDAAAKVDKARIVRAQQRIAANLQRLTEGKSATYAVLLAMASALDTQAASGDRGHVAACMAIADTCPTEVTADTDSDSIFAVPASFAVQLERCYEATCE